MESHGICSAQIPVPLDPKEIPWTNLQTAAQIVPKNMLSKEPGPYLSHFNSTRTKTETNTDGHQRYHKKLSEIPKIVTEISQSRALYPRVAWLESQALSQDFQRRKFDINQ